MGVGQDLSEKGMTLPTSRVLALLASHIVLEGGRSPQLTLEPGVGDPEELAGAVTQAGQARLLTIPRDR